MASSLTVQIDNLRKETVKTTPMMTLGQVLEEVCARSKGKLDPKEHQLLHNRKPVDLTSPLRFANIPGGAKLELQKDPAAAASSSAPAAAARPSPAPSGGAPASTSGGGGPRRLGLHTKEEEPSAAAGPPPSKGGAQVAGRDVVVYTEEALLSSRGGTIDDPEDDSFYEFTPEDYARVMAGHKEAQARQERGLLTKKLRDQDLVQKAEAVGTVRIRVCFPDGMIVEAGFGALEKVGALYGFARACTAAPPGVGIQLFTTPPKVVLKDHEVSAYAAGLAPAANVRVSWTGEAPAGPSLRPEVFSLQALPPAPPQRASSPPRPRPPQGGAGVSAPPALGAEEPPRKTLKEGGKPKWLKM